MPFRSIRLCRRDGPDIEGIETGRRSSCGPANRTVAEMAPTSRGLKHILRGQLVRRWGRVAELAPTRRGLKPAEFLEAGVVLVFRRRAGPDSEGIETSGLIRFSAATIVTVAVVTPISTGLKRKNSREGSSNETKAGAGQLLFTSADRPCGAGKHS